jgi:hypothetical protein
MRDHNEPEPQFLSTRLSPDLFFSLADEKEKSEKWRWKNDPAVANDSIPASPKAMQFIMPCRS